LNDQPGADDLGCLVFGSRVPISPLLVGLCSAFCHHERSEGSAVLICRFRNCCFIALNESKQQDFFDRQCRKGVPMKIGIIGAGQIGGTLTRRLSALGHQVFVSNSRGPESLAKLAQETGAKAVSVPEAAHAGELVIVTIPEAEIRNLPKDLFAGVPDNVVVIDTGNYYPQQRDGRIPEIESGTPESRWVEQQLGRPVVKAFNNIYAQHLMDMGRPAGASGRIALPIAGDRPADKRIVINLINQLGFDAVDAGSLDESWRQQPATPVYGTDFDAEGLRRGLAEAGRERKPQWRATAGSPGSFAKPA